MFNFDRKHFLGIAGALAISLGVAGTASAAIPGVIPGSGSNEGLTALGFANPLPGWNNASLYLVGGPANITIDLMGNESANSNVFTWGGVDLFSPGAGNTWGTVAAPLVTNAIAGAGTASGLLDFGFRSLGGDGLSSVTNANNPGAASTSANFFVSFDPAGTVGSPTGGGQIAYLWFDDRAQGDDDNHDDLVIRLSISNGGFSTVPLPAAGFLLLGGLAGLGLVSRRRKSADV